MAPDRKNLSINFNPLAIFLFYIALGVAWLWPVQGIIWERFYQEVAAVIGLILSILVVRVKSIPLSWPLVALFSISFIPLLQAAAGIIEFWGDAVLASLYLIIFLCSLVLGASISRRYGERSIIQPFCFSVLIVAALSSVIAGRQWLDLAHSVWEISYHGARPYANLSQPNHLARISHAV